MPRSLDPKAILTIVLACDVDKDPRPTAYARQPNGFQQMTLARSLETIQESKPAEAMRAAFDVLAGVLTGWENMNDPETGEPIPFCADNVPRVYSFDEVCEIIGNLASQVKADDKKKSE